MIDIRIYEEYNEQEILDLYKSVRWDAYTSEPEKLRRGFENSLLIFGAYDRERLVGILRTVGDGQTVVLIQDILIYPEYQRKGIGTKLVDMVVKHFDGVRQIQLLTDNTHKTLSFYHSLGFCEVSSLGCCALMKK